MSSCCIGQVNDQSLVTNSVFAGFIHEAVQENQQVILSCCRSVRGKGAERVLEGGSCTYSLRFLEHETR